MRKEWGVKHGEKFKKGMAYFNQVLKSQPYVAGESFSVADITAFCALIHGDYAGLTSPRLQLTECDYQALIL